MVDPHIRRPPILATDLDGTLIPLPPTSLPDHPLGADRRNDRAEAVSEQDQRRALGRLRDLVDVGGLEILFVTGRHRASILEVIHRESLPNPDWIIGDVGTTILHRQPDGAYRVIDTYVNHLDQLAGSLRASDLLSQLGMGEGLVLQEAEKQGLHKLSFYCDAGEVQRLSEELDRRLVAAGLPYRVVASVDPFNGDGLIDLLPRGVDKAGAIHWWAESQGFAPEQIVFAGDSGNDYAALTAGYRAVLVGNAEPELAKRVRQHHAQTGTLNRFYHARGLATAGVWEGLAHFTRVA